VDVVVEDGVDEAIRMCLDGRIKDAKTVTALLLWERMQS